MTATRVGTAQATTTDLDTRPIAWIDDERPAPDAPPPRTRRRRPGSRRSGLSVRTRLTAAVALAALVALGLAGAIVFLIECQRIDGELSAQSAQEFAELETLRREPRPDGTPYASVSEMLDVFLSRNVPEDNEVIVSWYDDAPQFSSPPGAATREFAGSDFFFDTVRPLLADNGTATVQVPEYGEAMFSVQALDDGTDVGALVVVTYLEEGRAGLRETMQTYAVTAGILLLLVTGFSAWLSGRLLAPLRTLRTTAAEIGDSDLSRRLPVRGNDDITALTRTVNGMLDRLEHAFVGQRRFLDDAGHELKTPLTILRGHLELLDAASPAEVAETRELLLDETDRMSRLVGDLILLAKSDRPDFVAATPTDVAALVTGVLAKARGLGERDWTLDSLTDAMVDLDQQRVTQALLQLCDNAVKHTTAQDTIALGAAYRSARAELRLWVRDTGVGVLDLDKQRIFERFGRGEVRADDEGFGLGLSIVHAIALAHGGGVHVEDARPRGARFVITLPATPPVPRPEEGPEWPGS